MSIWVFTTEFPPYILGGLGVVAVSLYQALDHAGDSLTLVTQVPTGTEPTARPSIVRIPRVPPYYRPTEEQFDPNTVVPWLRPLSPSPTVLHVHSVSFQRVVSATRALWPVPLVYTCHSLMVDETPAPAPEVLAGQEALLKMSDMIVVPSRWLRDRLLATYPWCSSKVEVIPNGVRLPSTVWSGAPLGDPRLLFVGRAIRGKGIEDLLHALSLLPAVRLDLIGTGGADYLAHLKALASSLHVADRISWLGALPHDTVPTLYPRYRAVVVPSHQESFGMVALEALAASIPLISTTAGGLAEFVSDEVAEVVPVGNPALLAEAVRRLIREPGLAEERARRGRALAAEYAWPAVAGRYQALFERLGASRP